MNANDARWELTDDGDRDKPFRPEYAEQAYRLALVGCTHAEMAAAFGVTAPRFQKWIEAFPDLDYYVRQGGKMADAHVALALYRNAVGYETQETSVYWVDGAPRFAERRVVKSGETAAQIAWLRNRDPQRWAQAEKREISGPGGRAVVMQITQSDHNLF